VKLYNLKHFTFLSRRECQNMALEEYSCFNAQGGKNGNVARNNVGGDK